MELVWSKLCEAKQPPKKTNICEFKQFLWNIANQKTKNESSKSVSSSLVTRKQFPRRCYKFNKGLKYNSSSRNRSVFRSIRLLTSYFQVPLNIVLTIVIFVCWELTYFYQCPYYYIQNDKVCLQLEVEKNVKWLNCRHRTGSVLYDFYCILLFYLFFPLFILDKTL